MLEFQDEFLKLHHMDICSLEDGEAIDRNLDAVDDVRVRIMATMGLIDKLMKNRFDRELERVGLTISQVQVLIYILREQRKKDREITAKELEQRFRVSNPTMSGILRRLEKKGFIERKTGSLDKRNKQICIKSDVEKLYRLVEDRVAQENERLFQGITKEELQCLAKCLTQILRNIDQDRKEE